VEVLTVTLHTAQRDADAAKTVLIATIEQGIAWHHDLEHELHRIERETEQAHSARWPHKVCSPRRRARASRSSPRTGCRAAGQRRHRT